MPDSSHAARIIPPLAGRQLAPLLSLALLIVGCMPQPSPQPLLLERVDTADGARIACKRLPAGGPPVIFVHGVAVNADLWDPPEIRNERFVFRPLPRILHELGYDIWLMNLRGHGWPHMYSTPPEGQRDWTLDHFVAYDLPAVVEHVRHARGQRPWLIANSLGAMITAGYLQGATIVGQGRAARVVATEELARCRREQIRGAVLLEFPAGLSWPDTLYDGEGRLKWRELWEGWSRTDGDANFIFEALARSNLLQTLIRVGGEVPLRWLRSNPQAGAWRRGLPEPARDALAWADELVMRAAGGLVHAIKGGLHFEPELCTGALLPALENIKAGVITQLGKCVRERRFVSGLGAPDHVYSEHYDQIASPLLLISGGRDRIANADVARRLFFERIRSPDKRLAEFADIAHGEFEWAPIACEAVYPIIVDWLRARDGHEPLAQGESRMTDDE